MSELLAKGCTKVSNVLILIILEVLYEFLKLNIFQIFHIVLILIILEVLYEYVEDEFTDALIDVLILIILEVLYEYVMVSLSLERGIGLNPYYTGSTL